MTSRSRLILICSALCALGPSARAQAIQGGASLPPTSIHQSEVRILGTQNAADSLPRTLAIALPSDYSRTQKNYPVIFVLDADGLFPLVSDVARILAIGNEIPNAIIVGLGYGRPYLETLAARTRDYTPTPVASRPGSGEARRFLRYLTGEVFPYIESHYRVLAGDRTLVGHSLGGTFALVSLLDEPGIFRRMVIGSPAAWDDAWLTRRDSAFAPTTKPGRTSVYLSVGSAETLSFLGSWRRTADLLAGPKYQHVEITSEILPGESHISSMPIATTHGLRAVFRGRQ